VIPSYANVLGRVLYPFYEGRIRGRKTFEYLSEYERNQWLTQEQLEELRLKKLRSLLEHCQNNVPFYRETWKSIGFDWRDIRVVSELNDLPCVSKEMIRENYQGFIADNWVGRTISKSTGGSTGVPFVFEYTRESYERRMAVAMRGYSWAGAKPGVKRLDLWGTDIIKPDRFIRFKSAMMNAVLQRRILSCFEMRNDNLAGFVDEIDSYRPEVIVAYTGALSTLARWVLANRMPKWRPRSIITGAEMLSDADRHLIESAFKCPVYNTYGCREVMLIGAECEFHRGYHLSADHLVVQVLDDTGLPLISGVGSIAITDLHNYGMPLVRYLNGDLGGVQNLDSMPCDCGRSLPILSRVEGRRLDQIRTPDGRILPGEFFPHLFKDFKNVRRFQVRQPVLNKLKILMVLDDPLQTEFMSHLRQFVERQLGEQVDIEFEVLDSIPLTASGKFRVTISELPGE
jgi:phenylacetate-CoA ligase